MEQKKENEWTKYICELLRKELDTNKYEITCLERVPYRANIVGFDDNGKEKIEYMKYQTDLLIKEIVNNNSIPRLIIESKFGSITSHDAITYSNKAQSHKEIYNGLRYGIMIAKVNKVHRFKEEWEINERKFVKLEDLKKYIKWCDGVTFKAQLDTALRVLSEGYVDSSISA